MYGRKNGQMVRPTDGWTDQQTTPHVEIRGFIMIAIEERVRRTKSFAMNSLTWRLFNTRSTCNTAILDLIERVQI